MSQHDVPRPTPTRILKIDKPNPYLLRSRMRHLKGVALVLVSAAVIGVFAYAIARPSLADSDTEYSSVSK